MCNAACGREHTVQQGDICYDIASSNGITLQELENLNPTVDCSALQLGATLCLGEGGLAMPDSVSTATRILNLSAKQQNCCENGTCTLVWVR